ncbi:MAG: HPr family phosphocarrier protein [Pseudomonadota bacterium]
MRREGAPLLAAQVTIVNEKGIHTRTATELVKLAQTFHSAIRISLDRITADAKSVIELLTLGAGKGQVVSVEAEGPDEAEALEKIVRFIRNGFAGANE